MSHSSSCAVRKGCSVKLGTILVETVFDRLQVCVGQWNIVPLFLVINTDIFGRLVGSQILSLYG
jgi:hypothetical protein